MACRCGWEDVHVERKVAQWIYESAMVEHSPASVVHSEDDGTEHGHSIERC